MDQTKISVEVEFISSAWKRMHIIFLAMAAIFGLGAGYSLATLFEPIAFLCRTPVVSNSSQPVPGKYNFMYGNNSINLDLTGGSADDQICDFIVFTFILSFIFGVVWMIFFIMCGPGGKAHDGMPQPWRIVLPALIFCTVEFFIVLAASIKLALVYDEFCSDYAEQLSFYQINDYCVSLSKFHILSSSFIGLSELFVFSKSFSWLSTAAWGVSVVILILRILRGADFHRVLVPSAEVENSLPPDSPSYQRFYSPPEEESPKKPILVNFITTVATIERAESSSDADDCDVNLEKQNLGERRGSSPISSIPEHVSSLRRRSDGGILKKQMEGFVKERPEEAAEPRKPSSAEIGCQAGEPMVKVRKPKKVTIKGKKNQT